MTDISVKLPHYGAISDFYELRYICALHQTGREIRKDGSIDGKVQLHMLIMMPSLNHEAIIFLLAVSKVFFFLLNCSYEN
jgi:hypothetical protein